MSKTIFKDRQTMYFPLIDVAKIFCAVLVVLIHCLEVQSGHPVATFIVKCFSAQAVPFFMITSGFFAANKINREVNLRNVVKLCIQNWLSIYCVWSILWLPYYIRLYYMEYPDASAIYRFLLIVKMKNLVSAIMMEKNTGQSNEVLVLSTGMGNTEPVPRVYNVPEIVAVDILPE